MTSCSNFTFHCLQWVMKRNTLTAAKTSQDVGPLPNKMWPPTKLCSYLFWISTDSPHLDCQNVHSKLGHRNYKPAVYVKHASFSRGFWRSVSMLFSVLNSKLARVAWCHNGMVSDSWSRGRGFDSQSSRYQVVTTCTGCTQVHNQHQGQHKPFIPWGR